MHFIVRRDVGRTANPEFEQWQAVRDKIEGMLDKVTNARNPHGPKWLEKTTRYYRTLLETHDKARPPRYLEDIGVEPLPGKPPLRGGGAGKRGKS